MKKQQRTSETHPIELQTIDNIWKGKLAITFAPGKIQNNAMTGTWNRCLAKDLQRIKDHYKMDVLVCLLEEEQMKKLKIPNLLSQCQKYGLATEWLPVIDNTVNQDETKYLELVKKVVDGYLREGKNVVVHCKGGLGRGGTFAAACLIYSKMSPKQAISLVRKVRRNTINCYQQQQWLLEKLKF